MEGDTYALIDAIYKHHRDKVYSWVSETQYVPKELVDCSNIVYFSEIGWQQGFIQVKKNMTRRNKELAKKIRDHIIVRCVIDGKMLLQDLGGALRIVTFKRYF